MLLNQLFGQEFTISDDDLKGFDKLPKGLYRLYVNSCKPDHLPEHNITKYVFECIVSDGEYQNRKVFLDFITSHQNPKVVEISMKNIKKFMVACGKRSAVNTDEAIGTFPIVEISYQKDKNDSSKEYPRYNFLQSDGQPLVYSGATSTSPTPQPVQSAAQPAQPEYETMPPWAQG